MGMSIQAVKEEFLLAKEEEIADMIIKYQEDTRTGVKSLLDKHRKRLAALEEEKNRIYEMNSYERKYGEYTYVCGIDEVGRGPLAGPVMAAAVILPKNCDILYINDSKQLTEKMREKLYDEIMEKAIAIGVGSVPPAKIDEINILQATYEAMRQAIGNLKVTPDILLNDAVTIPQVPIKQVPIIKGDAKSVSIAAASIIAKVARDRIMTAYDQIFPAYGFASNKGYGSGDHIEVLKKFGPTPLHRMSFIKNFI